MLVGATEHHAVLEPTEYVHNKHNCEFDLLEVDSDGFISAETIKEKIKDKTFLTSIMLANNETGTIQNLIPLVEATHAKNALFHTDAVQAIGKINVDVKELGVDLLTLTAHKIYGP